MSHYKSLCIALLCATFTFATVAHGAEVLIEEVGLTMTLPDAWTSKYEQSKIPTGQLLQRWVRDSVNVDNFKASPGLIAVTSVIPKNADLALITQGVLSREPYRVKLGVDTQCIKCVKYQFLAPGGGVVTSIAPTAPPNCTPDKPGAQADCLYLSINYLGLKIEPSWVNRFEKEDQPYGKSYYLVVHAIVDEKLVDLTFVYPKQVAQQIEPEIATIVSSVKKGVANPSVERDAPKAARPSP